MELRPSTTFRFVLLGQMPSGKGGLKIAYVNGRVMKYPKKRFKDWRADAYQQLSKQRAGRPTLNAPSFFVAARYTPCDRRRRDVPGIEDALCHLLEWCPCHGRKIVKGGCEQRHLKDDSMLEHWTWEKMPIDRDNPRLEIEITEAVTDA